MGKACQICGKNSGMYPLCAEHMAMKSEGLVEKCTECGKWHLSSEYCDCQIEEYEELPTEGFNKCVECGTETDGYAFCLECWKRYPVSEMLDILNKKIRIKNLEDDEESEDVKTEEPEITEDEKNHVVIINEENKSKCITCGRKTDGLLFCSYCYKKYKNKDLLFKITNCSSVELLDENYEGRYTCKDGHVVKSKSERDIDNYLFENGIQHAYEKELPYGAGNKDILHPDFYLPHYLGKGKHVYLEHWGYNENNIQYTKTKAFKMPIYKELGITLICTYEKTDTGKIDAVLERKLNKKFIKEGEINFED